MSATRQLGVGRSGGGEALAFLHQASYDSWKEVGGLRETTTKHHPRHHGGMMVLRKNRGSEQGDVDGPAECAVLLGDVATRVCRQLHQMQGDGFLPWADVLVDEVPRAVQEQRQTGGSDGRCDVQSRENGGPFLCHFRKDEGETRRLTLGGA
eukprot:5339008-Amphidinium_carterae.2